MRGAIAGVVAAIAAFGTGCPKPGCGERSQCEGGRVCSKGNCVPSDSDVGPMCSPLPNGDVDSGTVPLACGAIERVPGCAHFQTAISDDARYVAFMSSDELVQGDTNGAADVFLYDRLTSTIERVSVSSSGEEGNMRSECMFSNRCGLSITPDGRFVAFVSFATNLDTSVQVESGMHLYVRDRAACSTEIVDASPRGFVAPSNSPTGVISPDGRWVAFLSNNSELTPDDPEFPDIFILDRTNSEIKRLTDGTRVDVWLEDMTPDGRFVLGSLPPMDLQAFLIDRDMDQISVNIPEAQTTGAPLGMAISDDGRWITFRTNTPLADGETDHWVNVYLYDRTSGRAELMDLDWMGGGTNAVEPDRSDLTADGSRAVFGTYGRIAERDENRMSDIYVYDRDRTRTRLVSTSSTGTAANGGSYAPVITPDGHYVAFRSAATNLVENDNDGCDNIFVARICDPEPR